MQSGREDTLEERYLIKLCFKHGKNDRETYGMRQTAFGASCMNRVSVFEWHKYASEIFSFENNLQPCNFTNISSGLGRR